ncbi:MAG: virulence protein SciE type [Gammaproteobacteria bacterium]|nr:virulence protein SciE type [Gammaproteobacteria bacterium]
MSNSQELFRAGKLRECLAALQGEVRGSPADAKLRTFLAQLLMLTGDWDRAVNQLQVAGELDSAALPMKHAYTAAIECERLRAAVFAGERLPLILGDPPPWIAALLQALPMLAQGRADEAAALREQALEEAPATAGRINGTAFDWIADADSRLGPVLEVVLNGAYYWAPFSRVRRIVIEPPADVRDLAWVPAQITWSNEGEAVGLIPARYPGSERSEDDSVRMARKTEWQEIGAGAYAGLGQRILATSGDELGLLEVRELVLESA